MLSMPVCFSVVLKQDVWKVAFNKRQSVVQDFASLSRTAMQSSMEVAQFKTLMEAQLGGAKLSPASLAQELLKAGLLQASSGSVQDEDDPQEGSLSATFNISNALSIHKTIMNQPACVEILMDMETDYGTRSCFHQQSKLQVLASKPASAKSRIWVLQSIHDWLANGLLKVGDVSKSVLLGDKTHCGLVQLFETKQKVAWLRCFKSYFRKFTLILLDSFCFKRFAQVLDYIHETMLPQAGVLDADRTLLRDASSNHVAYRSHSGDGEVTWKGRMKPSGIMCFDLIEELVYCKKFDNGVKQAAKLGGTPEHVFEQEPIKEAWEKIVVELAKEAEERKASAPKADADEEEEAEDEVLQTVRKAPTNFALHSAGYWRAVANQCVRTYVTLIPEPKTTDCYGESHLPIQLERHCRHAGGKLCLDVPGP